MALRCAADGGGGGGAYLTPSLRSRCRRAGAVRPTVTTTGTRGLRLLPMAPSSPRSKTPRALRCSPDSPPEQQQPQHVPVRKEGTDEAWEALKAMVAPKWGCCLLWKAAPSVFVDAALAYGFYKLSVVSSELRRQGKCNDLFTRLKFGTVVIMATRDFRKNYELMDFIKMPVFFLYLSTFIFDVARMKKYAKHYLILTVNLLRTKGGFQEIFRIMFYPDYISAYDDCFCRK